LLGQIHILSNVLPCYLSYFHPDSYTSTSFAHSLFRRVYRWFLLMYNVSYVLGISGYVLMMLTIFQINMIFLLPTPLAMDISVCSLFYGLYYGVISRDFAEVCSDKMAAQIGYHVPQGMPVRRLDPSVCSICTNLLDTDYPEKIHKLNCQHTFHDCCIRGWCIVGKKDTCPYCKEKVNLKKTFTNPERNNYNIIIIIRCGISTWSSLYIVEVKVLL
uniref:RING-type domain-containing protein n=1 Tax=Echinostoma caproni TaxID=27848 RepID=A0A183BEZ4_9TREM